MSFNFKFIDPGTPQHGLNETNVKDYRVIEIIENCPLPVVRLISINQAINLKENLNEVLDEANVWIEKHITELSDEDLLGNYGWNIECENPFEIRHVDGSFATLNAAWNIVNDLRYDRYGKCPTCKESDNDDE